MRTLPPEFRPDMLPGPPFGHSVAVFCGVVMTLASALVIAVHPLGGLGALVFFGFSTAVSEANRQGRLGERTRSRLQPFVLRLRRGNIEGFGWLLTMLAWLDGRLPGARHRALVALKTIAARESLLDGLIFHSRRGHVNMGVFRARLRSHGASSLVPALASLHPDGHVREAAVRVMARRPRPAHQPFLLERSVDWVPQVRDAAQAALRSQLARRPDLVSQAQSGYVRIARRAHAAGVAELISAAADRSARSDRT